MTRSTADTTLSPDRDAELLHGRDVGFLAVAAALATASNYVIQPELTEVARDLDSTPAVISAAAGSAVLGYLLGLAVLVPLVDHVRADRLIAAQFLGLAGGLLVAAAAPNPILLGAGLFVSGVCASTGAQLSTLAAKHSPARRRGRAVGTVTAGISAGILLGRILGGALTGWIGWRAMLGTFAVGAVGAAVAARQVLSRAPAVPSDSYLSVIHSMPALLKSSPRLRRSAVAGALWFFAFSLTWVSLSLALSRPPLRLSPAVVGLYSLAGLSGILATRIAGMLADRCGSQRVVMTGLALALASTLTMAVSLESAPVLLIALAFFDAGLFSAQVANQTRVLSMDPERPARFNSAYMVVYFVGGTVGTTVGGSIETSAGWTTAAVVSAAAIIAAATVSLSVRTAGA